MERFKGSPADFTPEQLEYIARMFDRKGPVLVRMGIKKKTRFYSPVEWEMKKGSIYPKKNRERSVK
ncbi:MAG TPA: hypothetical protein PK728_01795 [Bacillota bacterium]|nr:hypothetical protein [Bacillota bacterium]